MSAGEVMALLAAAAESGYIGEPVSQLDHALQCAASAARAGAPPEEVLAALLHDVGHLCAPAEAPRMADLGVLDHEHLGAAWLRARGVSEVVCALVAGHVEAKRYLVATNPRYAAALSPASAGTLTFQGGPMSPDEVAAFDRDPLRDAKLRVRRWDELGKDPAADVPGLSHYAPLLSALSALSAPTAK
jgi:predicted HD phosphohydrolase